MNFAGLRVVVIGPTPPPAGGMAMQTRQLTELLGAAGAEVTLVSTTAAYRPSFVAHLRGLRALFRLLPYLATVWRAVGRCDVVHLMANSGWSWHLCAAPAIAIARLRGAPVLVNYRGGEAEAFLRRAGRVVARTMGWSAGLIVPSGFLQGIFGRHGMTAQIVPNVIDLQRFRPAAGTVPVEAAPHLVVARALEPIYDNDSAIRALALLRPAHPGARLTLAGAGPEEPRLRALVDDLELAGAVHFAGRLDRDAIAALLRSASVSLNPSLVDNMPNSVLEALASGVPVVSTDVGGVPFIVQDGHSALLVPPLRPDAIAAAVARLLDDTELRARLVAAGLEVARRYSWAVVGPILAEHYRRVARPGDRRAAETGTSLGHD